MTVLSRRDLLGAGTAVAVTAALPAEAKPRSRPYGDLRDIKHVVVVMQENRSFDHYFGAMKGVRGFGDRATILLPGGKTGLGAAANPRHRRPYAVPVAAERHEQVQRLRPPLAGARRGELPRHEPQLGGPARRLVRRLDERLGLRQAAARPRSDSSIATTSLITTPSRTRTRSATPTTAR